MSDWDLLTPGIGLTSIGIVGVGISLAGIAKTFVEGMHAVSLLTMFIGMIFLASGLFKDGFPSTGRAKSATFITLGFLVTFGVAAAVTVSAQAPSIFAYIGLMMIISIPAAVLTVASYRRTPYIKALAVIFIGGAIVGGISFYVFGLVSPKAPAAPQTTGGGGGNATTGQAAPPNLSQVVKATILPGASAKGNPNYNPKDLSVPKGAGIQWTNNDNVPHTVTSFKDTGKSFDSSLIMPKKTYTLDTSKLTQREYDYFCTIHPFMKAKFMIGNTAGKTSATSGSASSTASAGGAAQSAQPISTQPGTTSITILAGAATQGNPNYEPADGKVPLGNKVVWQNKDNTIHTATSGTGASDPNSGKIFDTKFITAGSTSTPQQLKGVKVGEVVQYYCQVHPYMTAKFTVTAAAPKSGSSASGGASTGAATAASGPVLSIPVGASTQGNPAYDPNPMTVKKGDTVQVQNKDQTPHTVTSGKGLDDPAKGKLFDTSIIAPAASAKVSTASLKSGEYPFHCEVHPYMTGTLKVQ